MFAKSERLTKKQFDAHYAAGKRFHFSHCSIIYSAHPTLHTSVVVGKKVAKSAVKRNTLRRRIYAQLYRWLKRESVTGVFIVLVKPSLVSLSRKVANEEIAKNIAAVRKKT